MTGTTGILATKNLQKDERSVFTSTDIERLDKHEGYICCSIEYPNAWYFDKAKSKDKLFKDWVILFINPKYLWLPGTRFCQRNAASGCGRNVAEGKEAFLSMFAQSVPGAYNKTFTRSNTHLACCPTDNQAEVLIPDRIEMADILGIAVPTEMQVKNEAARLSILGEPSERFNFVIAPTLFDKHSLSDSIHSAKRPIETPWIPRNEI
ncbi:MAG: DUF4433 domain-containing protein [Oscillatoriales cyanobacterium RU_3_3]|nr:DUF4433 domain-containing protein [Oscillatoriales cyanobacterium RU_3_3]